MIGELLRSQPEIALFASLALGYFIGSFKIGPIQLGGVCGTLIVALLLGQTGARLAPDLGNDQHEMQHNEVETALDGVRHPVCAVEGRLPGLRHDRAIEVADAVRGGTWPK